MVQVTIVKTVPSTSVPIATPPPQDTLRPLVFLPNATFVADGAIAPDFAPHESVTYSGSKKCPNVCMFFTKVDNP